MMQAAQQEALHCVFRRGRTWFALPAESVREVMLRPPLVAVPGHGDLVAGLCHIRSEFLVVLRLERLLIEDSSQLSPAERLVVVHDHDCPWGVLADEVATLAHLDVSGGSDIGAETGWAAAISGWAAWESESVRVLDPRNFRDLTEMELTRSWQTAAPGRSVEAALPN